MAKKLGMTSDELFDALYDKHYIDRSIKYKTRYKGTLCFAEYPDFATGLSSGKVKEDRNVAKTKTCKKSVKLFTVKYANYGKQSINDTYLFL